MGRSAHAGLLSESARRRVSALILLAIIALLVMLTIAMYANSFTATAPVTLRADRSGLQMRPGNLVQLRGVDVGTVKAVELARDGGVEVTLAMQPDKLRLIPANVTVRLEQKTAFGNKFVTLIPPVQPSSSSLRKGAVLSSKDVSVEANGVFDKLDEVLSVLQPAKVNAALGAVSQAVSGRGAEIGRTIDVTDAYLTKINKDIPQLTRDFDKGATVLDVYADATPDLMRVLANGTVTANTFVDEQGNFHNALGQLSSLAGTGRDFLAVNGNKLVDLVHSLIPTTSLLQEYSPEIACFLQGVDKSHDVLKKAIGGTGPGIYGILTFQPGNEPYSYPRDLPNISANDGPNCHGMPNLDGTYIPLSLMKPVDRGGEPNPPGPDENQVRLAKTPLVLQLFGPLAGTPAATAAGTTSSAATTGTAGAARAAGGRR